MRSGAKLLLLLSGGKPYLLRDTMSETLAAGAVDGTPVYGGKRSVTDSGSLLSMGGGVVTIAGSATSFTDPRLIWTQKDGSGWSRAAGLAAVFAVRKDTIVVGDEAMAGWRSSVTGGSTSIEHGYYSYRNSDRYYRGSGPINLTTYPTEQVAADTWVTVAIILRESGCHLLRLVSGREWTRIAVDNTGSSSELWPSIQQSTGLETGTYDNVEIRQIPGWGSDAEVAQVSSATAGSFTHDAECWFDWISGGVSRSLIFRKEDATNYLSLDIDGAGALTLNQTVDGVTTPLGTWVGPIVGTERITVSIQLLDDVRVNVDDTQRIFHLATPGNGATLGELTDDATSFFVWRRTETLPFDVASSSPSTALLLESGDNVTSDASYQLTGWIPETGPTVTLASVSGHAMAWAGVPFLAQNPDLSVVPPTIAPPYDIYALVNRNIRPGGSAILSPRGLYIQSGGPAAEIAYDTGIPDVNTVEVSDVAITTEAWQRVRIHVNGLTSFVQVEDDKSALTDLGAAALAGELVLLARGHGSGGLHGWCAYFRIVAGDVDGAYHAARWSEMASRATELAFWESTIVTADTSHNAFPGYCILADGSEIMAYRKATAHASKDGVIVTRSRANSAAAWGAEATVLDLVATGWDCRDVSLLQLASGRVILTGDRVKDDDTATDAWCLYSDDGGATWSALIIMGHPWLGAASAGSPVEIGGAVYCPVYGHNGEDPQDIGLCVTLDDAATWGAGDFVSIAEGTAQYSLQEPTLIVIGSEWCVLARGSDASTRLFTSTDSGASWTLQGIVFRARSPHVMVTLGGGDVACFFRDPDIGFANLRYRVSSDALRTWTDSASIKPHHTNTDYVAAVRRSDGVISLVASLNTSGVSDIHYFERDETDL